jgi:hypothetical protein
MGAKSANKQAAASEQAQQDAYNQGAADAQPQAVAAPAPVAQADDDAAEIQKYAALKGQGLITEEEFEAKKKQILGI